MRNLNLKVIFQYLRPYKKEFLYGALALKALKKAPVCTSGISSLSHLFIKSLAVESSRFFPSNKIFRISGFDRLEDIYLFNEGNYPEKIQFEVSKPDPTKSLFVLDGLKLSDQISFVLEKS